MTANTDVRPTRSRWRRLSTVLTSTTATLLLAGAGAAGAAAPQQPIPGPGVPEIPSAPAVGETFELPLASDEFGLTFTEAGRRLAGLDAGEQASATADLEGNVDFRVADADPLDPWSMKLEISGFAMKSTTAETPAAPVGPAEQDQGLGEITIEQGDFETTPESLVKMISQSPPKWEQTMFLDFTMTIERPPETAAEQVREPLVLSTKEPGKLIGQLDNFPPKGEIYQLENPIKLVIPDNPEETIAQIDKFPVKVGGF
ncbi:hypothetical protein [Glycomyces tarimensis]